MRSATKPAQYIENVLASTITDSEFLTLITSSDEAAEIAANNPACMARLNGMDFAGKQIFDTSCTAHVIMTVLRDRKLIPEAECNHAKEFEIHRKIWTAPGQEANAEKIIAYLMENQIQFSCVEFTEITNRLLELAARAKVKGLDYHSDALKKHSLFKTAAKTAYQAVPDYHKVEATTFKEDDTLLLVETASPETFEIMENVAAREHNPFKIRFTPKLSTHIVFGQHGQGLFTVFNPSDASTKSYTSLEDYIDKEKKFTGITFNLKK